MTDNGLFPVCLRIAVLSALLMTNWASAAQANRPQPPNLYPGPLYQPPGMVYGSAFKDRILPIPIHERLEEEGIWGADGVVPRDIHNGIEDPKWSYWCISGFKGADNRYHMYACRWPEDDPRGHNAWPASEVVYATGDKPTGPFTYQHTIGKAHNAEVVKLKDDTYAIFFIGNAFYVPKSEGPGNSDKVLSTITDCAKERQSHLRLSQGRQSDYDSPPWRCLSEPIRRSGRPL